MKKLLCAALISTLILSVGCRNIDKDDNQLDNGTNPPTDENGTTTTPPGTEGVVYVDGVYRAEMDDKAAEVNTGWKDYVEVTIADGKISNVDFDSKNTEGKLRSKDTTYTMEPTLKDWLDNFVDDLLDRNDINDENDTVQGSENYRKLVSVALENAKEGNQEVAVVSTDEMK